MHQKATEGEKQNKFRPCLKPCLIVYCTQESIFMIKKIHKGNKRYLLPLTWTKSSNGTNAFTLISCSGHLQQKTSIYCLPPLSKTSPPAASTIMVTGRDSIHHCLELHWSHTQAQSSSGALPFVFFLLLSFAAPTAALISSLVLSSALLPNV